jgi:hypothetical protein
MEFERRREVIFLTSSDQPQGIDDDAFLCAALTEAGVPYRWVVWDSTHGAQLLALEPTPISSGPASWSPICINRSMWTGYDASGAKPGNPHPSLFPLPHFSSHSLPDTTTRYHQHDMHARAAGLLVCASRDTMSLPAA